MNTLAKCVVYSGVETPQFDLFKTIPILSESQAIILNISDNDTNALI